jgi:hypothetical protein
MTNGVIAPVRTQYVYCRFLKVGYQSDKLVPYLNGK